MGPMANLTYTLRSGRRVGVTTLGDADAERIVVFCHPAPGTSVFDPDPDASATRNVHIVALDRPGYGSSDPVPYGEWPSIVRAADDIAEYLRSVVLAERSMGVRRVRTVGIAGWSEHTVLAAFQKAESDRLGGLAPAEAIQQLSGQLQPQADAVLAAAEPGDVPPEAVGATAVDDAVLAQPGVRDRLGRMLHDAFRQGTAGAAADILSYTARSWGFEPGDVRAKTLIVGGQGDAIAGNAHAAWYQKAVPDSRMEMVPGVGHLVIVPAWGRVLAHLAPNSTR